MKAGSQFRKMKSFQKKQSKKASATIKSMTSTASRVNRAVVREAAKPAKRPAPKRTKPAAPRSVDLLGGAPQPAAPMQTWFVRTMGIILALFGLILCAVFLPLGIVALVAGAYLAVKARAIADRHNEKDRFAAVEEADRGGN